MISDRDRFCAIVSNGPLLRADASVVLCGEDAEERAKIAVQILKTGGAPFIVLSGGRQDPPRIVGAKALAGVVYGMGIAPDRVLVENESQHTRQQADAVVNMAIRESWHRLLLVASPYHQYRAFLTFVQALKDRKADEAIQVINVPASQLPWGKAPNGMTQTRLELLSVEFDKIDDYGTTRDVASYADGLSYLSYWEGR